MAARAARRIDAAWLKQGSDQPNVRFHMQMSPKSWGWKMQRKVSGQSASFTQRASENLCFLTAAQCGAGLMER